MYLYSWVAFIDNNNQLQESVFEPIEFKTLHFNELKLDAFKPELAKLGLTRCSNISIDNNFIRLNAKSTGEAELEIDTLKNLLVIDNNIHNIVIFKLINYVYGNNEYIIKRD